MTTRRMPARKPTRAYSMDHQSVPPPGPDFNVVFIGAGGINFGSEEGPWNHSFRLEHKLGIRIKVVGLIDPVPLVRQRVLAEKRASFVRSAYADTREYDTLEEYLADLNNDSRLRPDAVIVGCPPQFRGSMEPGRDIEVQLSEKLPGVGIFVEKPVTSGNVEEAKQVAQALEARGGICSVAYMFRYLAVVNKVKEIIEANNLHVMATVARYVSAYPKISKQHWWTKSMSGGPVVEQGTHFADLCRYFGGNVDIDSVQATSLEWNSRVGKLSAMPFSEDHIPEHERVPRVTSATWRYESGAVGSFFHAIVMQGTKYDTMLEIYADGYQFKIVDPYNAPELYVRTPLDDQEDKITFPGDDPYYGEISAFIDAIDANKKGGKVENIRSTFADACATYELTWAIRQASERALEKAVTRVA